MAENRITLIMEGVKPDEGHVRFDVFIQELQSLKNLLGRLDSISAAGSRNSHFAVVGLSHSSPARVELEQRPNRGKPDIAPIIFNTFNQLYECIEKGDIGDQVDFRLLADIKQLTAPVGASLNFATLLMNGSEYQLTEKISKQIDTYMADYEECHGSVEGMLEKVNVHADANVFTVYPDVGPNSITCHFPTELLDKVFAAGKRKVCVSGVMRFRKFSPFPHHVDVESFEIYRDADELAGFQDIFGIAPNATGELSSEEFIKELRCGWQ